MELFPATDDSAWQLIEDVIDGSDYYVLIVGGRYGSLDEAGLGYTEKEYKYACSTSKPVIPLLHENPDNLPRDKTETDAAIWEKLKAFRKKVEKKHTCVYWRSADDLKAKVIVGLTTATKRHPAVGWVRADQVPSETTIAEILKLRTRITELEEEATALQDRPPEGTEALARGDDEFEVHLTFDARKRTNVYPNYEDTGYSATITPTWNSIFASVAPRMINEATDGTLRNGFHEFFEYEAKHSFEKRIEFKDRRLRNFEFRSEETETCVIQLRALGLIRESDKKRSLKDTSTYWTLTPYGNTLMVQL